jgi:uncharacterized protein YbjT (DUF2867 family)
LATRIAARLKRSYGPFVHDARVLVTGATGAQGGAVALAMLRAGASVKALTRNPRSQGAQRLQKLGVSLTRGDLDDPSSLDIATRNVDAVFSVQIYNPADPDAERRQARALIDAALDNNVPDFIQTSVSGVGQHTQMPGWADGRWDRNYWENKAAVEAMACEARFSRTLVLRPAFMMENFAPPKQARMFPDLAHGVLKTAIAPRTEVALVATADIGAAAALALGDLPARCVIELAGEVLTSDEIVRALNTSWGVSLRLEAVTADQAIAGRQSPGWVRSQEWLNEVGYPARPEAMQRFGLAPTRLVDWAKAHRP